MALCIHDARYPAVLRELGDPPRMLHLAGSGEHLDDLRRRPVTAIVGSRRPSAYGLEVARSLGRGLADAGVVVVSGLALGIDAAAHEGCLEGGGLAVAVMPGGVDVVYPRSHRRLHRRIVDTGLAVSELPPGTAPYRWSFPARNRIMAALSVLTIVVEAAAKSGSLITADVAAELGRTVAAVPGRVTSRVAAGTNRLLHEGAAVIRHADDALDILYGAGAGPRRGAEPDPSVSRLDPGLRRVLDSVEAGRGPEALAAELEMDPGDARAALSRLELLGLLVRDALGGYERRASP